MTSTEIAAFKSQVMSNREESFIGGGATLSYSNGGHFLVLLAEIAYQLAVHNEREKERLENPIPIICQTSHPPFRKRINRTPRA